MPEEEKMVPLLLKSSGFFPDGHHQRGDGGTQALPKEWEQLLILPAAADLRWLHPSPRKQHGESSSTVVPQVAGAHYGLLITFNCSFMGLQANWK